ncbi:MAG: hypothetical protein ACYDFT_03805 [Thermoplasmata archaeon]
MQPDGPLIDAAAAPAETLRLLAEEAMALAYHGIPRNIEEEARCRLRAGSGHLDGALWIGPKGDAVGIAYPRLAGSARFFLFLTEGYRGPAPLARFLNLLDGHLGAQLMDLSVPGLGPTPPGLAAAAEALGYRHLERDDMVYPPDRPVPAVPQPTGTVRNLAPGDAAELVELWQEAFSTFPLDSVLLYPAGPMEAAARAGVSAILDGRVGRFRMSASFGLWEADHLSAAVLVNDRDGPLISLALVASNRRGGGRLRALLARTVKILRAESEVPPRLVVTRANTRARSAYLALGWSDRPTAPENRWIHLGRMGRPDLLGQLPREGGVRGAWADGCPEVEGP